MTAMTHLAFRRTFSPLLFLLLLSGHLLLNKHNSCVALRFMDEPDRSDGVGLGNEEAKRLNELPFAKKSDYLIPLDLETQQRDETDTNNEKLDAPISQFSQLAGNNDADGPWPADTANSRIEHLQSNPVLEDIERRQRRNDALFLAVVATCSVVGILGLVAAAIFWYKIQKRAEAALDSEYPSYGVTGPSSSSSKISSGGTITDRKLAQSAQMFHYQQQRQQMMAQEKNNLDTKPVHSDDSDDETPANGDYTVYECPGLAPTGEMEVRNPLFAEPDAPLTSPTSVVHPTTNNHYPQPTTSVLSSSPPKEKSLP